MLQPTRMLNCSIQSIFALYKARLTYSSDTLADFEQGASPPAVGWAAVDSLLLGSLHNYRLFFIRHGVTERHVDRRGAEKQRLTLLGHGFAGLLAGWTRLVLYISESRNHLIYAIVQYLLRQLNSSKVTFVYFLDVIPLSMRH
jgi:hypothetical protein